MIDIKKIIFVRGCEQSPLEDGCAELTNVLGATETLCVCSDKDNCNGSTLSTGSVPLLLILSLGLAKLLH